MAGIPEIGSTSFGEITVGDNKYAKDIYILVNGAVTKRKKSLAREAYGTSHKIGPTELKKLCKGHPKVVFIGTGHSGLGELTEDGRSYLEEHHIAYELKPTPEIGEAFNHCDKPKAALIHVTC